MAMILILYVQVDIQTSYGQQQPALPSLRIKVQMDKAVIAQGNTQTIEFQVSDAMTHQPIGGAVTSVLVRYPDVRTVRQFTATTDILGHSTVSWKIEDNAPLGTYTALYGVSETGYISPSGFDNSFSVVSHSINQPNSHQHHSHNNHPSSLMTFPRFGAS